MALTSGDYKLWRDLKAAGHIPPRPRVLEIGQANWWGDVPLDQLRADGVEVPIAFDGEHAFHVARAFYKHVLDFSEIVAIDKHGTAEAIDLDLNSPLPLDLVPNRPLSAEARRFDIVINTGTAEHVFNQCQLFASIHDATKAGGLMVHAAPLDGWHDHGFYRYEPCFWRDLATANGYRLVYALLWGRPPAPAPIELGHLDAVPRSEGDSILHTVWRKYAAGAFRVPMQGRYRH
jgi:hypothetical protein